MATTNKQMWILRNNIGPVGTRYDPLGEAREPELGKIKTYFSCIPELTTNQEQAERGHTTIAYQ